MADLETLTMTVETSVGEADDALKRVTAQLKGLGAALQSIDTKSLSDVAKGLKQISQSADQTGLKKTASEIKKQVSGIAGLKKHLNFAKGFGSGTIKGVKGMVVGIAGSVDKLKKTFGLSTVASSKFLRSLIRIAGYRMIRTALSAITKGASTGLQNLARASSEANATLSQLSSGALTLQNAMGGALYSVLASIIGVLNTIVNAAVNAINWISMLFAILGGRGTFQKATTSTKKYASALGGAAGGAKALKQELMGFDEINSLSPDTGGGGGGGGAGMLDYGSMFEETPVSDSLKEMVDKADFSLLGKSLANKLNNALGSVDWSKVKTGAYKLARSLVTFLNGFIEDVDAAEIGDAIQGLVNAGLTAINTFAYDTNWEELGRKIKLAIQTAIMNIKPQDVGLAFKAKFNAIISFLKGFIPKTPEEWTQITDWVADCINASIDAVTPEDVGNIIGRVITGGLSAITSLGEAGVFSNIAKVVFTAIETAIKSIKPEDIERAVVAILKEAWNVIKLSFDLAIEIGDLLPAKMITGYALYRTLAPALKAAGVTGYKSVGTNLQITGAIVMAIDAMAHIKDIVDGAKAGNGISVDDVISVISSALTAAGIGFLKISPMAGGILLGVGLGIELINQFVDMDAAFMKIGQVATVAVGTAAVGALENLEQAAEGATLSETELANVTELTSMALADGSASLFELFAIAASGKVNVAEMVAILENLGITSGSATDKLIELAASFESTDTNGVEETVNAATTAVENLTGAVDEMPIAIDIPITDSTAETNMASLGTTMQATGEQAVALKEKIIAIPADIAYNLELSNYETVIGQFETLKTTTDEVATGMKASFTSINWFGIGSQISTAFKRGIKSVKMPTISVSWKTSTKTASFLGEEYTVSVPTPTIKLYAKGGFPDAGELFMANENGVQELVGRVGNKPAVANQDQIGDAIFKYMDAHSEANGGTDYNAMANALVGAMKTAGLGALYLDGKMLKASLNKEAQRSGRPALGY